MKTEKITISVSESIGDITGELITPNAMKWLYVFAHGAGAGMTHPFMVKLSKELAEHGVGTLRYNFPYMEKGSKRPDVPAVAEKTVMRAIATGRERYPDADLLAGGKSFGGRMTSQAVAKAGDTPAKGLVFVGFPLHAAGKPGIERAAHLKGVRIPMLFLQGTRDALADIGLMEQITRGLPASRLYKVEGADHSFRAGKQDLTTTLATAMVDWAARL